MKTFAGYFTTVVSSESCSVSDLRLISSFPIFLDSLSYFLLNSFNSPFFSNIWSDQAKVAWILVPTYSSEINCGGVVVLFGDSVYVFTEVRLSSVCPILFGYFFVFLLTASIPNVFNHINKSWLQIFDQIGKTWIGFCCLWMDTYLVMYFFWYCRFLFVFADQIIFQSWFNV